jgi:hypothetical protein
MKAAASTLVLKLAQLIINQMSIIDNAKHAHPLLSMCIPGETSQCAHVPDRGLGAGCNASRGSTAHSTTWATVTVTRVFYRPVFAHAGVNQDFTQLERAEAAEADEGVTAQ